MLNVTGGSEETFEAILYDPAYHPTPTGDGIIVFQYNTVDNVGRHRRLRHGRDPELGPHRRDLLYTYFNHYPAGAATLAAGRAIRFLPTTAQPSGTSRERFATPPTTSTRCRARW